MSNDQVPAGAPFHFEGFDPPHYTQVPDAFFDVLMPVLSDHELRALAYIIRHTFGYGKHSDAISFSQFLDGIKKKDGTVVDGGCGVGSRSRLSAALKSLEEKGIITAARAEDRHGNKQTTIYSLRMRQGVVPNGRYPSAGSVLGVLPERYQQETTIQETIKHNSIHSNDTTTVIAKEQRGTSQPTGAASILKERPVPVPAASQPAPTSPPRRIGRKRKASPALRAFMEELSAEFHDEDSIPQNIGQALTLLNHSGLDERAFITVVYDCRSVTKQAAVLKPADGRSGLRNKMPYFFAVLRDRLGLEHDGPGPMVITEEQLQASLDIQAL